MCNLANTIHTICLHPGSSVLRSHCAKGLLSGLLSGCGENTVEGMLYLPSLCAGCSYRATIAMPSTMITFRAIDGSVTDFTSIKRIEPPQSLPFSRSSELCGKRLDKLSQKQKERRVRTNFNREVQMNASAELEIAGMRSPRVPEVKSVPPRNLEQILEGESFKGGDDVRHVDQFSCLSASVQYQSRASNVSFGLASEVTLQHTRAVLVKISHASSARVR